MMHSAPISRAAVMVFSRCCATRVSTVGTPVMSMMANLELVATTVCSRLSITTWVRALSSVPMMGSASMPSQSLTTGVESSSSSCCWREISSSRVAIKASVVIRASRSSSSVAVQIVSNSLSCCSTSSRRIAEKQRLLQRQDKGRHVRGRESLASPRG